MVYLIRAMRELQKQLPDVGLVIAGYGPEEEQLKAETDRLGLKNSISFIGKQTHAKIVQLLHECRVAAVPSIIDSRGETEGMPTVVVEAMAAGVPVVGSRVNGIPDVIRHAENGWLCEQKKPGRLGSQTEACSRVWTRWDRSGGASDRQRLRLETSGWELPSSTSTASRLATGDDGLMSLQSILRSLRSRRQHLEGVLAERKLTHTLSLARYRLHHQLASAISTNAKGDCLDAGAGRSPYGEMLAAQGHKVVSIDIEDRSGNLDIEGDIQCMPHVASGSFDTVLCSQVLEHVPRPWEAMNELARVLRPGGQLIVTVPHLSWIHEAPHDYYRYTMYGLRHLSNSAGLVARSVKPTGGLFCFLLHGVSVAWMSLFGALPGMRWPAWALNYVFLVRCADLVDRCVGVSSVYPCDYLLVAVKEG